MTPALTFAEGVAVTPSFVPGTAFEDVNRADTLQRAEAGAVHARRAAPPPHAKGAV